MSEIQKIVIVGASSSIAEHCARQWAEKSAVNFVLVGRNLARLEAIALDLRARSAPSTVEVVTVDFEDAIAIRGLVDGIGAVDVALIAHGSLPDQRACEQDLAQCEQALVINGLSPVLFAEAFAATMQRAGKGTIAIIGSVAGDRARKSNYVYGAAKGLVEKYAQGLQHRFAFTGVRVVLVKPGPTDTPMTAHLKQGGARLADVQDVARDIVAAVTAGKAQLYTPGKWALIMMVIRNLPRRVFNHMNI
jgi:decaprenylphospho-beta-D-erythro-pentofuranosid-2-ulose 2-reductase